MIVRWLQFGYKKKRSWWGHHAHVGSHLAYILTVEVVELWTIFHEHYSLLGWSSNTGHCISTDHSFAYKDCNVCRSSHFYEAVYFCLFEIWMGISMLSHFSIILRLNPQFNYFSNNSSLFKSCRTPNMILIRCYAQILRSRSPRGNWVQKIKVVGNSFLSTYPKKFFEYLAYLSSYTHFIVSIIRRLQL